MYTEYPLKLLITNSSEHFQLKFASEAAKLLVGLSRVQTRSSHDGLTLNAVCERDLEVAWTTILSAFPSAQHGPPEVVYIREPQLLEPCMIVVISTPEDVSGDVIGDLIRRRGAIQRMDNLPSGEKEIEAEIPLAEMFGYPTALRALTQLRATYTVAFSRYLPISGGSPPPLRRA